MEEDGEGHFGGCFKEIDALALQEALGISVGGLHGGKKRTMVWSGVVFDRINTKYLV